MAKIVIIGAGLTGLSAAYHLEKRGFFDYQIFEKENEAGGLCRSIFQDGFTFDFTGHLLHASDSYFRSLIEQVVGIEHLNSINRRSCIYSQDTYTKYPYQINLYGLPIDTVVECIEGYVARAARTKHPETFWQWVHQQFGAGFARHFFIPYQQKIFAYDLRKITASWTSRFVPQTSLAQILRGTLQDVADPSIGYNANFLYPKQGGISFLIAQLKAQLKNPIHTNFCVKRIHVSQKYITFSNGQQESFDQLITTMPLDLLLDALIEPADAHFISARSHLKCNKVINFNLGISREAISDKHWIYFPEKKYPFYRIGFPHNFSPSSAPAGCSSLYGEFAHVNKSATWVKNTLHDAVRATKQLLNIDDRDVVTECVIPINHAYVIYDAWRDRQVPQLLAALALKHMHSVGRYGEWKYSSMQEAVLDGKRVADLLTVMPAHKTTFTVHTPVSDVPNQEKRSEVQLT